MDGELWRCSAAELAALTRARSVSVLEVVQAHLDRIEEVNGRANAATEVLGSSALAAARHADNRRGSSLPPLHGLPFAIKGNLDVVGSLTSNGLRASGPPAAGDAPLIAAFRSLGAIPLLRTNLPELGLAWHTENDAHGATRNPFDPNYSPGGSSGGDAVAVATGMVPIGLGNDLGGSLRLPAQFCGVTALRPTVGSLPGRPSTGEATSATSALMAVDGPIARRVGDLGLLNGLLDRSAGPAVPVTRRFAVVGGGGDDQVDRGIAHAAAALTAAGYELVKAGPPVIEESAALWRDLVHTDARALLRGRFGELGVSTRRFVELSFTLSTELVPKRFAAGLVRREELVKIWSDRPRDPVLVLGPISRRRPFLVGVERRDAESVAGLLDDLRLTLATSLLDLPAVVVPVGLGDGLPCAVQLVGRRGDVGSCLEAATTIEAACPPITPVDPR